MKFNFTALFFLLILPIACVDGQPECQNTFDCDIGESCVDSVCVVVTPEDLAIEFFRADTTNITVGDNVELSWSVDNAERCTINDDTVACSGVAPYSPLTTTTYTLRGESGATSVFQDIEITVSPLDAGPTDGGTEDDAGLDAGPDNDAGADAGPTDSGADVDAGLDAGPDEDAGIDAGPTDSGTDVDAGLDAGPDDDAGVDAGPTDGGADVDAGLDAGPTDAVETIAVGYFHACVLLDNDAVKCWGANNAGQLGQGDTESRGNDPNEMGANLPSVDLNDFGVAMIASGNRHTCALLNSGAVKCWGGNNFGQLGLGDTANRGDGPNEMGVNLPNVDLGGGATKIAVGASHSCALLGGGAVKCWGGNNSGQLGQGDTEHRGDGPDEMGANLPSVDLGGPVQDIAASSGHTCALLNSGAVKCWGGNSFGQLGLGDTDSRGDAPNEMGVNLPSVDLGGGTVVVEITIGKGHSCALLSAGDVKCWGRDFYGQLGLGLRENLGDEPNEMGDSLPAIDLGGIALSVSGGQEHSCALLSVGDVKCWGRNNLGQLGQGDTENRADALDEMGTNLLPIDLGEAALEVSTRDSYSCALLSSGDVKCWGHNSNGQLGLGDTDSRGDDLNEMGVDLPAVQIR